MNYNEVVSNTFGFNTVKQAKQQMIIAKKVSEGFFADVKGKIELRELCNPTGHFPVALSLKSNMSGKEWTVPWDREAGSYQITDGKLSFVIKPAVPSIGFGEYNRYRVYVIKE